VHKTKVNTENVLVTPARKPQLRVVLQATPFACQGS